MIKITQPIIVEGKYDKIKLSGFIDGIIIETDGFRIFADKEKQAFIRHLAKTKGIIILTDSDAAGFKIRNYIKNIAADGKVTNVYIPDIYGKEKRKAQPSKEGKLGVEGVSEQIITEAMEKAGVTHEHTPNENKRLITTADLFSFGFTGCENAKENKYKLLRFFGLPSRMSNAQLLKLLNSFITYDDFVKTAKEISAC